MFELVVADDEMIERKVLEKMISQGCEDVKILPGVGDGVQLIKCIERENPDIAVIDINMPGFNGLDAMEIIRMKQFKTKFIVVSAYSKFEYAQKAMLYGANEYLLKPVKEEDLIHGIQRLCAQLKKEKEEKQDGTKKESMAEEIRTSRENELISEILLGELNEKRFRKYLEDARRAFKGGVMLTIRAFEDTVHEEIYTQFMQRIRSISLSFGKKYKDMLVVCVLSGGEAKEAGHTEWIKEILDCMQDFTGQFPMQIGVSLNKEGPSQLHVGFLESMRSIANKTESGVYYYSEENAIEEVNFGTELQEYQDALKKGQSGKIKAAMEVFLSKSEKIGVSVKTAGILMAASIYRVVRENMPEKQILLLADKYFHLMTEYQETDTLKHCAEKTTEHLFLSRGKINCSSYVRDSLEYMLKHYSENIVLEQVANEENISSFYLSRLFKQDLDNTFLNILTNLRLIWAIELLENPENTVQNVSEQVGYPNVSYFYKFIKKQTGFTVNELRRLIRSGKN